MFVTPSYRRPADRQLLDRRRRLRPPSTIRTFGQRTAPTYVIQRSRPTTTYRPAAKYRSYDVASGQYLSSRDHQWHDCTL